MNLWTACEGSQYIKPITVQPWRVVEAQHILSSRDLVDTTDEHDILEALLEESKPSVNKAKHYLIFTPFRYPPLKYGSRFGRVFEPSLWYGSMELETAFAEVAYYQLQFQNSTDADLDYIDISLTAFNATISTEQGVDLTAAPFSQYAEHISSKNTYEYSQQLGTSMRESDVSAFIFFSARSQHSSKNVAAFTPDVFCSKKNQYVHDQQTWACIANKQVVEFTRMGISAKSRFSFTHNSLLPLGEGAR